MESHPSGWDGEIPRAANCRSAIGGATLPLLTKLWMAARGYDIRTLSAKALATADSTTTTRVAFWAVDK